MASYNKQSLGIHCVVLIIYGILHFFALYAIFIDDQHSTFSPLNMPSIEASLVAIELILVVLTIVLALGAFSGFWMLKNYAISAAEDIAAKRAEDIAAKRMDKLAADFEEHQNKERPLSVPLKRQTQNPSINQNDISHVEKDESDDSPPK